MPRQDTYVSYPSALRLRAGCRLFRFRFNGIELFPRGPRINGTSSHSFICVTKFLSISTCAYCRAVGYSPAGHRSPQCEPGVPHEPARLHEYLTSVR
jgi:hypothetical protein